MAYKDYLKSNHWLDFRKQILSIRKQCQKCLIKRNLNLHHINYKNLGKEKNEDIIVLCQSCHNNYHKKKKWEKAYKKGEDLTFTYVTNPQMKLYNLSNVYRLCNRCGNKHPVFYKIFKNGRKVLSIACPYSKPRILSLKYEELDVPIMTRTKGIVVQNVDFKRK